MSWDEYMAEHRRQHPDETEKTAHAAILPADGERLTFGVHRLDNRERGCAAWPLGLNGNPPGGGWHAKPRPKPSSAPYAAHHRWLREAYRASREYTAWRATGQPIDAPMPGQVDFAHA